MARECRNALGQLVSCQDAADGLLAGGIYWEWDPENPDAPTGVYVDVGDSVATGVAGQVPLPPPEQARHVFIDDPLYKHILKYALIALVVYLVVKVGLKAI